MKKIRKFIFAFVLGLTLFFTGKGFIKADDTFTISKVDMPSYIGKTHFSYKTRNGDNKVVYCYDGVMLGAPNSTTTLSLNSALTNTSNSKYGGLAAILKNGYPNKSLGYSNNENYYITQVAMWWYMDIKDGVSDNTNGRLTSNMKKNYITSSKYFNVIKQLVEGAKNYDKTYVEPNVSIYNSGDLIASGSDLVSDKFIKLNTKGTLSTTNYDVTLNKMYVNGTLTNIDSNSVYLINKDGNKINPTTGNTYRLNLTDQYKFYIRNAEAGKVYKIEAVTNNIDLSVSKVKVYSPIGASNIQSIYLLDNESKTKKLTFSSDGETRKVVNLKFGKIYTGEDNTTPEYIIGAKLYIARYTNDENDYEIIDEWESAASLHVIDNFAPGKYFFAEESAPFGFSRSNTRKYFRVANDGTVYSSDSASGTETVKADKVFNMINVPITFGIQKVNENGNVITGATMKICEMADSALTGDTNCGTFTLTEDNPVKYFNIVKDTNSGKWGYRIIDNGKVYTNGLFIITEVSAPNGYALSDQFAIMGINSETGRPMLIGSYGDVHGSLLSFVNTRETNIKISKTDMGATEISGASMKVTDLDGNVIDEWISNGFSHDVYGLKIGDSYILSEEASPSGYTIATSIKFKMVGDKKAKIYDGNDVTGDELSKVSMKNDVTKLYIKKTDIVTGKELAGAKLKICTLDGYNNDSMGCTGVHEWVSTSETHEIEMLPKGDYVLIESIAPAGYIKSEKAIKFSISDIISLTPIEMENVPTKVTFYKKDLKTEEFITGAHFKLYNEQSELIMEWDSASDAEGKTIYALPFGKYKLVESLYPASYQENMVVDGNIINEYEFTIDDTSTDLLITVYNQKIDVPNTGLSSLNVIAIGGLMIFVGYETIKLYRRKSF